MLFNEGTLCYDDQQQRQHFSVELVDQALDRLAEDARNAYRVYELFLIRWPADVWKCLWVRLIQAPATVWANYERVAATLEGYVRQSWPAAMLPLVRFDEWFYDWGAATLPEEACWLAWRSGVTWRAYGRRLWGHMQQTQATLRASADPLIRHEIAALEALRHPYDEAIQRPFMATTIQEPSLIRPQGTPGFYTQLLALLALLAQPELRSVACGGGQDYATLRWICTEQRRRATATGLTPMAALAVGVRASPLPVLTAWQAEAVYGDAAPVAGELWIQPPRTGWRIEVGALTGRRWLLLPDDAGELAGYQRTVGEGWAVYAARPAPGASAPAHEPHYQALLREYAAAPRYG